MVVPMAGSIGRRDVAILGVVLAGGWLTGRALRRTAPIGRDVRASGMVASILSEGAPASGPANASLRMAVFSDYRCAACRRAYPALAEAVRADGDVRVLHKDWPIFGPPSERAAQVSIASAWQGIHAPVHARLMTDARTIDDAMLADVVTGAGGDWARLTADLAARGAEVAARLRANAAEARAIGLPGTPGYLAGPLLVLGAIDAGDVARLFARARALR